MRRQLKYRLCPLAIPLYLWLSSPVMGQDCSIMGHITDSRQAAVATAIVTVTSLESGSKRQILSNAQGDFQLTALPPGKYQIDAVKPGFRPLSPTGVELSPGSAFTLDLLMDAQVSQTVSLEARKTGARFLFAFLP
jgi:hypothetical protein